MMSRGVSLGDIIAYKERDKALYYTLVQHCYDMHAKSIAEQRLYHLVDTAVAIGACISKAGNKAFKKHYKDIERYINSLTGETTKKPREGMDMETFITQSGLMGVSKRNGA